MNQSCKYFGRSSYRQSTKPLKPEVRLLYESSVSVPSMCILTIQRRVALRRGKRREVRLIAAVIALIQQGPSLLDLLTKNIKLNLLYDL